MKELSKAVEKAPNSLYVLTFKTDIIPKINEKITKIIDIISFK